MLHFLLLGFIPTDFGAPFRAKPVNEDVDFDLLNHCTKSGNLPYFSATAVTCSQMFVVLLMHVRSHLSDPPLPGVTQKILLHVPAATY